MCRERTCLDWFHIGKLTCSELTGMDCPCDGCCLNRPPPPPSPPQLPPSPLPSAPPPFDTDSAIATAAAAAAALVGVVLVGVLVRARQRRRAMRVGLVSSASQPGGGGRLGSMRCASDTELSSLAAEASPQADDEERAPGARRPSITRRAERYRRLAEKKVTHRKQGGRRPGAALAASDGDHSMMYEVTLAWRAAMRVPDTCGSTDGDDGDESAEPPTELHVVPMLEAIGSTLRIAEVFGPLLGLGVKNDQANLAKVQQAHAALSAADPLRVASLRGLLETERSKGIHQPGGLLADPSAAIAMLWMRRSLTFTNETLNGIHTDRQTPLANAARDAYRAHLESYHNFWLKNTFRAGLTAMPRREDFVERLAPSLGESLPASEREAIVYAEMGELVEVQAKAIAAMAKLYLELDMEDQRKV